MSGKEPEKGRKRALDLPKNPFEPLSPELTTRTLVGPNAFEHWIKITKFSSSLIVFHGLHGSGRSSHLRALKHFYPDGILLEAPLKDVAFPFQEGQPVFIDDFHLFPKKTRQFLLTLPCPLVITSNRAHKWEFRNLGRKISRVELFRPEFSEFLEMINARLELFQKDPGKPAPRIDEAFAKSVLEKFAGNAKMTLAYLHEEFERKGWESLKMK